MSSKFNLRDISIADYKLLFNWANDEKVRKNSINQGNINIAQHKEWFYKSLDDSNTKIFILEINGLPVGQIRWNLVKNKAKLDYSISSDFRGLGFGKKILKMGIEKLKNTWSGITLVAEVKEGNKPSINSIISAGFEEKKTINPGYLLYELIL